eukprot:CAMPEP_0204905332 /NCGR_PEP_ID=MMETSP1397-20131031/5362_1 /ASSEMBLY_ACC=CAM_ASM_000891 /TAXON_ID=49980 /ORGANISM="Climacostomum Climacostomum virens, Strain Stock W-24" /LENGTH=320 /DNA_ID=CAMNT_0052074205 /DNA_START=664 /DNA_END=1626 /DNA_ORIENTATION=+
MPKVGHAKVSRKKQQLKRKQPKEREHVQEAEDLVNAEGFVILPEVEAITDEAEAELAAFRAAKTTIVQEVSAKLAEDLQIETDPKVVEVYTGVGRFLSHYKSGKLPKAFLLIPSVEHWEQLTLITNPEAWSPQASYKAAKIFISSLQPKQAQRFLNLYLLPAVRRNIAMYKKLNVHYYKALSAAVYKPGGWIKGILLPLCLSGDCSLREASIIGSVIAKNSIPMPHACAAMLKLSEMEYTGAVSYFMQVFIKKRYSLPFRVLDAISNHFARFSMEERKMPVLWHGGSACFCKDIRWRVASRQSTIFARVVQDAAPSPDNS